MATVSLFLISIAHSCLHFCRNILCVKLEVDPLCRRTLCYVQMTMNAAETEQPSSAARRKKRKTSKMPDTRLVL